MTEGQYAVPHGECDECGMDAALWQVGDRRLCDECRPGGTRTVTGEDAAPGPQAAAHIGALPVLCECGDTESVHGDGEGGRFRLCSRCSCDGFAPMPTEAVRWLFEHATEAERDDAYSIFRQWLSLNDNELALLRNGDQATLDYVLGREPDEHLIRPDGRRPLTDSEVAAYIQRTTAALARPDVQALREIVTPDLISDIGFASWLHEPEVDLDGRTPIELLDVGIVEIVRLAARHWANDLRK